MKNDPQLVDLKELKRLMTEAKLDDGKLNEHAQSGQSGSGLALTHCGLNQWFWDESRH